MLDSRLTAAARERALERLAASGAPRHEHDVLVFCGGNGADGSPSRLGLGRSVS